VFPSSLNLRRLRFLLVSGLLSTGLLLAQDSQTATKPLDPASPVHKTLHVAANGTGDYSSVQQAIDAAPDDGATIQIAPGIYREVVTVAKPNIHLHGGNRDAAKTVIVFNKSAGHSGGTFHSATVTVTGDGFSAENLTFQNDWNATHTQVPVGSQALALSVTGDKAYFKNVRLLGNQDTLYAANHPCAQGGQPCAPSRQYFTDCYIAGNVDFIFGDSKAVFDHCEIHSTPHSVGMLTAQSKNSPDQDSGYVFDHCRLTADPGVTNVYLGRPWRPYATVIFLNTEMGSQIAPEGWREWHPGQTHSLSTAYFAEYNSSGPGAAPGGREPNAKQLTAAQAAQFETVKWLDGWNPTAGKGARRHHRG
jgi:pectin methylesterase-like acyl-CoA thioesterase